MKKGTKATPELRERGVRILRECVEDHGSEWAAMRSVAAKLGCSPETLRTWVRKASAYFAQAELDRRPK